VQKQLGKREELVFTYLLFSNSSETVGLAFSRFSMDISPTPFRCGGKMAELCGVGLVNAACIRDICY
jgi:hypothetical protein